MDLEKFRRSSSRARDEFYQAWEQKRVLGHVPKTFFEPDPEPELSTRDRWVLAIDEGIRKAREVGNCFFSFEAGVCPLDMHDVRFVLRQFKDFSPRWVSEVRDEHPESGAKYRVAVFHFHW